MIGHRERLAGSGAIVLIDVPRPPRCRSGRASRSVRVEHDVIAGVVEPPQDIALARVRVDSAGAVCRRRGRPSRRRRIARRYPASVRTVTPVADRGIAATTGSPDRTASRGSAATSRSTYDIEPPTIVRHWRALPYPIRPMVIEEPQEVVDRELEDPVRRGGPHRRGDRGQEMISEAWTIALLVVPLAERRARRRRPIDPGSRVPIEAQDVGDHPPVGWSGERARPGEEPAGAPRTELDTTGPAGGSQRHLTRLRFDPEVGQQPDERRVRVLVVDDEPGVDRQQAVVRVSTATVLTWPPTVRSPSYSRISWSLRSAYAAASPLIPEPTMATFTIGPHRSWGRRRWSQRPRPPWHPACAASRRPRGGPVLQRPGRGMAG